MSEADDGDPEQRRDPIGSGGFISVGVGANPVTRWGSFSSTVEDPITAGELHPVAGVQSIQGVRPTMEDEHTVIDNTNIAFFGVYDGHGGKKAAEFLRDELHKLVLSHPKLLAEPESVLQESIKDIETRFLARAKQEQLDDGSTLAVVLIVDTKLITANVGDSEIVLCRNGKPMVLSEIHNLAKSECEESRIKGAGGVVWKKRVGHPYLNPRILSIAVTRSIGDLIFKDSELTAGKTSGLTATPYTRVVDITHNDSFIIMGCDGLWDVMTYDTAIAFVKDKLSQGISPQQISEALTSEAMSLGSQDNITVLVVTLT